MTERWDFAPACAAEFPNDNPALHAGASWACLGVTGPLRPIVRARPRPLVHDVAPAAARHAEAVAAEPPAAELRAPEDPRAAIAPGEPSTGCGESSPEDVPANDVAGVSADTSPPTVSQPVCGDGHDAFPPSEEPTMEPVSTTEPVSDRVVPDEDFEGSDSAGIEAESVAEPESAELKEKPVSMTPVLTTVAASDAVPAEDPRDPYEAFVHALTAVAMANGASRGAAIMTTLLDGSIDLRVIPEETLSSLARAGVLDSTGSRISEAFGCTANAWREVLRNQSSDFSACGSATLDVFGADLLRSLGVDGGIDVRKELRRRGVAAFGMRVAA